MRRSLFWLQSFWPAVFGLFYAGAYLAKTVHKPDHESPLRAFLAPPSLRSFREVISFHITRRHLLLAHHPTLEGHLARAVLLEGLWLSFWIHSIFNLALDYSFPEVAFVIGFVVMFLLKSKLQKIN